jgi:hypothetical protein
MNWYKHSQQQMLFYPFDKSPSETSQKVAPISVDPNTKENIYQCHKCNRPVLESEANWYKDVEGEGESLQLPEYDEQRISQAFMEIAQYLTPFYNQLQEYIKKEHLESPRDDPYSYSFDSTLRRWEVQIPQLNSIINKYPEIQDICAYKNTYGHFNSKDICSLINGGLEINGKMLNDLSDFIQSPTNFVKEITNVSQRQFNIDFLVPTCSECFQDFQKCEVCSKVITPDQQSYPVTWDDRDRVCEKCVEDGHVDLCGSCGKADYSDEMSYSEDLGFTCSKCTKERSDESIEWAEQMISQLDIPVGKNYPISGKKLNNLDSFLTTYIKKYGDNELNDKEYGRITHLAKKSRLSPASMEYLNFVESSYDQSSSQNKWTKVSDLLNDIHNSVEAQDYMTNQYPELSSYQDLPFDINVVESYSRSKSGFTITITPSQTFFDYAKTKYPQIEKVWQVMSQTPHHGGSLAYARCGYEGGDSIVINNLQRDADYDNYEKKDRNVSGGGLEAARWIDGVTKHWDVFLLNLVKSIAISSDKSAFLTTFDQQKKKWGNLPIHKSKSTYEKVPEQMGFPLNDPTGGASGLVEEHSMYDEPMYQIANDIAMNWYKRAQTFTPAPITIVSYNSYGELGISFNGGKKYVYPNVSPYIYDNIKKLLKYKNYKKVQEMLQQLSVTQPEQKENEWLF